MNGKTVILNFKSSRNDTLLTGDSSEAPRNLQTVIILCNDEPAEGYGVLLTVDFYLRNKAVYSIENGKLKMENSDSTAFDPQTNNDSIENEELKTEDSGATPHCVHTACPDALTT